MNNNFMKYAYNKALDALANKEVPVGCVIICSKTGEIISSARNMTIELKDPSAHAEVLAIRESCQKLNSTKLYDYDIYTTLEPCPMCAQLISITRFKKLYFGAYDYKGGGVENGARIFNQTSCFHTPEIYGGFMEKECSQLLTDFFKTIRKK